MGVHASLFHLVSDAQQFCDLQQEESDGSKSARPQDDHQNHDDLGSDGSAADASFAGTVIIGHAAKSAPTMIVIKTLAPVEQSCRQQTPYAAEAVHRAGIHRVVDVQFLQEHGRGLVKKGRNKASGNGTSRFHAAATCCDGHQPTKDAIAQSSHIVLVRDDVT